MEKQGGQVRRVRSKESDDQRAQRAGQGQIMWPCQPWRWSSEECRESKEGAILIYIFKAQSGCWIENGLWRARVGWGDQSGSICRGPGEVWVEAWTRVVVWNWSNGDGVEIYFGVGTILSCQWVGEKRRIQDGSHIFDVGTRDMPVLYSVSSQQQSP